MLEKSPSCFAPDLKMQMVFISGEGAGSQLTKDMGKILSQLPTTVEALTGVDITKGLERYLGGGEDSDATKPAHDSELQNVAQKFA